MIDDELINRIRQGDETAAEELIHRWYPSVLRYCRYRLRCADMAADMTQETFLRLFRSLDGYRREGKFKPYLFSIANRLCIDENRREPMYPLEEGDGPVGGQDAIRQAEDRDEIRGLLAALPPEQREAVLLRYGELLSYRDIARVTGCNLRTAQSRVKYALRAMRKGMRHE